MPKTLECSAETNQQKSTAKREVDVYVFALLRERSGPGPLNIQHWTFFVVATHLLEARTRRQHSITQSSYRPKIVFNGKRAASFVLNQSKPLTVSNWRELREASNVRHNIFGTTHVVG